MPRPNRYQSLHTTVIGEGGHQFEVQIRTEEMHRIAEEGIAAHWKYKAGGRRHRARTSSGWPGFASWSSGRSEMTDPNEFLSTLKIDLYPEEVYTFTPKGKVVVLPKDAHARSTSPTPSTPRSATPASARKVNGRMVPLRTKLRNGDIVEIVTQNGPQAQPRLAHLRQELRARATRSSTGSTSTSASARSRSAASCWSARRASTRCRWLRFDEPDFGRVANEYGVATASRPAGHAWAWQVLRAPGAEQAGAGLRSHADDAGRRAKPPARQGAMSDAVRKLHLDRLGLAAGGRPERSAGLSRAMLQSHSRRRDHRLRHARQRRRGARAQLSQRAEPALRERPPHRGGVVARSATSADAQQTYPVRVVVYCDDRAGMLKELTAIISDDDTNIRSVDSRAGKDGEAIVEFIVEAEDVAHLDRIVTGLRTLPGVRDVERASKL